MNIAFRLHRAARGYASCFFALLFSSISLSAQSSNPDLLLLNAHVVTMNDRQPSAQAIATQGDRILWVGSTDEAKRLYPKPARTMDLHGATVLPGIIDAHTHLINLGESLVRLNLKDIPDEKEIIERVKQRAASVPFHFAIALSKRTCSDCVPLTSRDAPAPTPNSPIAAIAASRNRESLASPR